MLSLMKELKLGECVVPYCSEVVNDGNSRLFPKISKDPDLFEWWLKLVSNAKLKQLAIPVIEKLRVCKKHFNRFDVPTNLLPSCASNDLKKYLLSKRKNVYCQTSDKKVVKLPVSIGSTKSLKAGTMVTKTISTISNTEKLLNSSNGNLSTLSKNSEPEVNKSGGSVAIEKVIIGPKIPTRNPTFLSKDFLKNVHIDPEKVIVLSDESDSQPNSDDDQGSTSKLLPLAKSTPLKSVNKSQVKRVVKKPPLNSAKLSETAIRAVQNNQSKWKHILIPNTVRAAEQLQLPLQSVDQSKTIAVKANNNNKFLVLQVLNNNSASTSGTQASTSTSTPNKVGHLQRLLPKLSQTVSANQNKSKTVSAASMGNEKRQLLLQKIRNNKRSEEVCNLFNSKPINVTRRSVEEMQSEAAGINQKNINGPTRSIEQIRFESKQNEFFKKCLENEMKILRRENTRMRSQLNTLRKNMSLKNKQLVLLRKEVRAAKNKHLQLMDLPEHLRRFFYQQLQHSRCEGGKIAYSEEEKQLAFVVTGCDRNLYKNYRNYFYAPGIKTMAKWRSGIDKELDRRKKELYVYVNDPNQIEDIRTIKSKRMTYRDTVNDSSAFDNDIFDEDTSDDSTNSDSDSDSN